jgi:hypothetical protein
MEFPENFTAAHVIAVIVIKQLGRAVPQATALVVGALLATGSPGLVSWFRSSHYHRYQGVSELRNQNDTGIN